MQRRIKSKLADVKFVGHVNRSSMNKVSDVVEFYVNTRECPNDPMANKHIHALRDFMAHRGEIMCPCCSKALRRKTGTWATAHVECHEYGESKPEIMLIVMCNKCNRGRVTPNLPCIAIGIYCWHTRTYVGVWDVHKLKEKRGKPGAAWLEEVREHELNRWRKKRMDENPARPYFYMLNRPEPQEEPDVKTRADPVSLPRETLKFLSETDICNCRLVSKDWRAWMNELMSEKDQMIFHTLVPYVRILIHVGTALKRLWLENWHPYLRKLHEDSRIANGREVDHKRWEANRRFPDMISAKSLLHWFDVYVHWWALVPAHGTPARVRTKPEKYWRYSDIKDLKRFLHAMMPELHEELDRSWFYRYGFFSSCAELRPDLKVPIF